MQEIIPTTARVPLQRTVGSCYFITTRSAARYLRGLALAKRKIGFESFSVRGTISVWERSSNNRINRFLNSFKS